MAIRDQTALSRSGTVRPQALFGPVKGLVARFKRGLWGYWLVDVDPGAARACVGHVDRRVTLENGCLLLPHDGRWRRPRKSHGRLGLARSGRMVGSRESDDSPNGAGLVVVASANLGGSCHCEWPSAREGERREEAKWGTRRCRDTAFARCVCNRSWGQRELAELNCLARTGFAARQLGDSAACRPVVGSPAQWQKPGPGK